MKIETRVVIEESDLVRLFSWVRTAVIVDLDDQKRFMDEALADFGVEVNRIANAAFELGVESTKGN